MPEDVAYEMVLRRRRHELAYARYLLRSGAITSLLVLLTSVGVTWTEGRPIDRDRSIDLAAAAIIALGAGCSLAGRKIMRRLLRKAAASAEPANPRAKSTASQLQLLAWAGVIMTSVGFALLLLFALSIGWDRPEWTAWLPGLRH